MNSSAQKVNLNVFHAGIKVEKNVFDVFWFAFENGNTTSGIQVNSLWALSD